MAKHKRPLRIKLPKFQCTKCKSVDTEITVDGDRETVLVVCKNKKCGHAVVMTFMALQIAVTLRKTEKQIQDELNEHRPN